MNEEEKLIELIKEIINTQAGFKFFEILLAKLGAFERGCNFENIYNEYYNKGKREKGLWLLDLAEQADIEAINKIKINRR